MLCPLANSSSDHDESDSAAVERLTDHVIARASQGQTVNRHGPVIISVNPSPFNTSGIRTMVKEEDNQEGLTYHKGLNEIDKALDSILSRLRGPSDVHCLIQHTGQSGSGKTFLATYEADYLISHTLNEVSPGLTPDDLHPRVLLNHGVRLMELFVNAQTNDNPNSSRFIKRVKLDFASGKLCSIALSISGWERSRVILPRKNERSYHILEAAAAYLGLSSPYGSVTPASILEPPRSAGTSSWTAPTVMALLGHFFDPSEVKDLWEQVLHVVKIVNDIGGVQLSQEEEDGNIPARILSEEPIVVYGRVLEIILNRINNRLRSRVARFDGNRNVTTRSTVIVYDVPGFERVDMMGLDQFLFNLFSEAMYSGLADILRYSAKSLQLGPQHSGHELEFSSLQANGRIYSRFCEAIQASSRDNLDVTDLHTLLQDAGTVDDPEVDGVKLQLLRLAEDAEGRAASNEGPINPAFIVRHQIGNVRYNSSNMVHDDRLAPSLTPSTPSAADRMRAHVRDWIVDIKAATPDHVLHVHSVLPRRRPVPLVSTHASLSLCERYDVRDQLQNANFGLLSRRFLSVDPQHMSEAAHRRGIRQNEMGQKPAGRSAGESTPTASSTLDPAAAVQTRLFETRGEAGGDSDMSPLKPSFTKGRTRVPFSAGKAHDGSGGRGGSISLSSQLARDIDILERKRKDETEQQEGEIKRLKAELAAKTVVTDKLLEAQAAERARQSARRSELRERVVDADIRTIEWIREFLVRIDYGDDLLNPDAPRDTTLGSATSKSDSTQDTATAATTLTATTSRLRDTLKADARRLHSNMRDILSPAVQWQVAVNTEQAQYRSMGFADVLNEAFAEICECGDIIRKLLPLQLLMEHWCHLEDAAVSAGDGVNKPDEIMPSRRLIEIGKEIEEAITTRLKKELLEAFDRHAGKTHPKVLAKTTAEAIRSLFCICNALAGQDAPDPFSLIRSPVLEFLADIERRYDNSLDEHTFGKELTAITAEYALDTRPGGGFGDVWKQARA